MLVEPRSLTNRRFIIRECNGSSTLNFQPAPLPNQAQKSRSQVRRTAIGYGNFRTTRVSEWSWLSKIQVKVIGKGLPLRNSHASDIVPAFCRR